MARAIVNVSIFICNITFIVNGPVTDDKSNDTLVVVLAVCLSLVTAVVVVLVGYMFWKRRTTQSKSTSNLYEVPLRNIQVLPYSDSFYLRYCGPNSHTCSKSFNLAMLIGF